MAPTGFADRAPVFPAPVKAELETPNDLSKIMSELPQEVPRTRARSHFLDRAPFERSSGRAPLLTRRYSSAMRWCLLVC